MLNIISRLLKIADEFAGKIKIAFVFSLFEGTFSNMPIFGIFYILNKIVNGTINIIDVWISGGIALGGIVLQYIFRRLVLTFQSATGYHIFERERIKIGDRFKRFPMGFFSEDNMGNVSAVITSDFTFIEMWVMNAIDKVVNGYISITIGCAFLVILDYRIALISIGVTILAVIILNKIQSISKEQSYIRQKTGSELVSAVLEYVQGIAVIKAFNMSRDKSKATKEAFKKSRDNSIIFEKKFIPPNFIYENCFFLGTALTIFLLQVFT